MSYAIVEVANTFKNKPWYNSSPNVNPSAADTDLVLIGLRLSDLLYFVHTAGKGILANIFPIYAGIEVFFIASEYSLELIVFCFDDIC